MNCPVRLLHYEVPVARGAEGGALRDAMSLCLSVRLFDCRSPKTRICRILD